MGRTPWTATVSTLPTPGDEHGGSSACRRLRERWRLAKIAYSVMDHNEEQAQELLTIARDIKANTLLGSFPPDDLMRSLRNLLDDNGIRWAVIGGIALAVHGQVRSTEGIDVLVDKLPPNEKISDPDYMGKFGFYRSKSSTGKHLVLDHKEYGQVELLASNNSLCDWAVNSVSKEMVLGYQVPVVGADALIGLKLQAVVENPKRKGKDIPDIQSVLLKQELDLSTVESMLSDEELSLLKQIKSVI